MGLEFLARVRRSSMVVGLIGGLVTATYSGPRPGLALALGAAWSLVNLFLLEKLVVAITGRDRGTPPALKRAAFAIGGMTALFGAGGVLLLLLHPVVLLAGFLVPFAVIVLKAASLLLLGSRAWKWLTASPWRVAFAVASLVVAAWWLVPSQALGPARATQTGAAQARAGGHGPEAAAETPAADEHAAPGAHAEGGHGEAAGHGGGHEKKGPQKFPNLITYITAPFPDAPWAHFLHYWEVQIFALAIALLICLVAWQATRRPQRVPGGLQNLVEMLVGGLNDFIVGILGPQHGPRFVPFLGSLFLYIWVMNLIGLIPGMESPTSSLNTTFALGITVFLYAQWVGIRSFGPLGYVHHMLGAPRDAITWGLAPLMLPIHILGELAKPISLSARLFGNIFGEDMLLVAFTSIGIASLAFLHLPFGLPLQFPFLFLVLLTGTLQALVFTVLSTIYLLLMLPHEEHHGEEAHAAHAH
jgi:F-type H+-transporting ATPase subunit a